MKIGLWNIDHPEAASGSRGKETRFRDVAKYLANADCEVFIITEANAALELPGYSAEFSEESPFRKTGRCYEKPNQYHQVGIYSKTPIQRLVVAEPVNGLLCRIPEGTLPLTIYGNVMTIKDARSATSVKKYSDRVEEQIAIIEKLPEDGTLVGGDFNLLPNGYHSGAHRKVENRLEDNGWVWPTKSREDTVQHVLHSPELRCSTKVDFEVKHSQGRTDRLSDHPFMTINLS